MFTPAFVLEKPYRDSTVSRFQENRKRLLTLIYSMKTFTEDEIFLAFSSEGDVVIDTEQTLSEYLQQLVYLGVLQSEFGKFSIQ